MFIKLKSRRNGLTLDNNEVDLDGYNVLLALETAPLLRFFVCLRIVLPVTFLSSHCAASLPHQLAVEN